MNSVNCFKLKDEGKNVITEWVEPKKCTKKTVLWEALAINGFKYRLFMKAKDGLDQQLVCYAKISIYAGFVQGYQLYGDYIVYI